MPDELSLPTDHPRRSGSAAADHQTPREIARRHETGYKRSRRPLRDAAEE